MTATVGKVSRLPLNFGHLPKKSFAPGQRQLQARAAAMNLAPRRGAGPVHGEILIKRPSGAEPSHDNRLASDSVQGWPEAVLNPRLSHPGYYRANLGALGSC